MGQNETLSRTARQNETLFKECGTKSNSFKDFGIEIKFLMAQFYHTSLLSFFQGLLNTASVPQAEYYIIRWRGDDRKGASRRGRVSSGSII